MQLDEASRALNALYAARPGRALRGPAGSPRAPTALQWAVRRRLARLVRGHGQPPGRDVRSGALQELLRSAD
eukprot:415476-Lingulodinium_polyedra.AAC.1